METKTAKNEKLQLIGTCTLAARSRPSTARKKWRTTRAILLTGWVPTLALAYWSRGFQGAPDFVLPVVKMFAALTLAVLLLAAAHKALRERRR